MNTRLKHACKTPNNRLWGVAFFKFWFVNSAKCSRVRLVRSLRENDPRIWEYFYFTFSNDTENVAHLKYVPCRPGTRLVVGVKIQTENATHLVPRAESAAWSLSTSSFKATSISGRVLVEKKLKHCTRCVFHTPILRTNQNHASLKSPKVGVEESAASAPSGVQLQLLINWMLRFHVGNPREFHHLRLKGVQWRHQSLPRISESQRVQEICPQSARSSRLRPQLR